MGSARRQPRGKLREQVQHDDNPMEGQKHQFTSATTPKANQGITAPHHQHFQSQDRKADDKAIRSCHNSPESKAEDKVIRNCHSKPMIAKLRIRSQEATTSVTDHKLLNAGQLTTFRHWKILCRLLLHLPRPENSLLQRRYIAFRVSFS